MNDSPADFHKTTEVRDYVAENGIKWGVIAQGLVLFVITSGTMGGAYFADRLITSVDQMNKTLIEVRGELASLNTGVKVNETRLNNVVIRNNQQDALIGENHKNIESLYRIVK